MNDVIEPYLAWCWDCPHCDNGNVLSVIRCSEKINLDERCNDCHKAAIVMGVTEEKEEKDSAFSAWCDNLEKNMPIHQITTNKINFRASELQKMIIADALLHFSKDVACQYTQSVWKSTRKMVEGALMDEITALLKIFSDDKAECGEFYKNELKKLHEKK